MNGSAPGGVTSSKVKTETRNQVGIITLNDPSTLNAAGVDLLAELHAALEDFFEDDAVRSIIITAEGHVRRTSPAAWISPPTVFAGDSRLRVVLGIVHLATRRIEPGPYIRCPQ